jgi:signal transduction histidine kinase
MSGVVQFLGESDSDALLAEIELPPLVTWGSRLLALVAALVAITGTLVIDHHDQATTSLLVSAMLLPWLLEAVGVRLSHTVFATMVLIPPAVEVVAVLVIAGLDSWRDQGATSFGSASSIYLAMVLLISISFAPRRHLVLTAVAALAIYAVRGVLQDSPFEMTGWAVALLLTLAASAGIRMGAIGITRAQRAAVARDAADRRRQIARDVHDVVAHTLAVTMLHVTAARMALLRADSEDATEALEQAERTGRSSLADVRRIIRLLRTEHERASDEAQPTLADVPALVEGYESAGLAIRCHVNGPIDAMSPTVGLTAYRVVQEALTNVARHGDGSATIDLRVTDQTIVLVVRNPVRQPATPSADGSGIRGMRERVEAIGGTIAVGPADGTGDWQVRVELGPPVVSATRPAPGAGSG